VKSSDVTGNISRLGVKRSFSNSERSRRRWNAGELVIRRTLSEGNFGTVIERNHNRLDRTSTWRELSEKVRLRVVARNRDVDPRTDLVSPSVEPVVVLAEPVEAKPAQLPAPEAKKTRGRRARKKAPKSESVSLPTPVALPLRKKPAPVKATAVCRAHWSPFSECGCEEVDLSQDSIGGSFH